MKEKCVGSHRRIYVAKTKRRWRPAVAGRLPGLHSARAGSELEVAEPLHDVVFLRREALVEAGIVEFLIPLRITQTVQAAKALFDFLPAIRRKLAPLREELRAHGLTLFRGQFGEGFGVPIQLFLLLRRKPVPLLEVLTDLRLLLGRQAAEALIVLQESFTLLRAHLPELFLPPGRQVFGLLLGRGWSWCC